MVLREERLEPLHERTHFSLEAPHLIDGNTAYFARSSSLTEDYSQEKIAIHVHASFSWKWRGELQVI